MDAPSNAQYGEERCALTLYEDGGTRTMEEVVDK